MSYIGRGTESISNVEVLDNLTFNGSASYTLQKSSVNFVPSSANNLLISISGVVQQGNFSVSGSTITFDTTVSASDTCDWILHYGTGLITTVADGAITEAKLGSNAVTTAKINNGAITSAKLDSGLALGKIGQMVQTTKTDLFSTSSTSLVDITGLSASITPSSTSSKIFVMLNGHANSSQASVQLYTIKLLRDSTGIGGVDSGNRIFRSYGASNAPQTFSTFLLDEPSTTSSINYKAQVNVSGDTVYIGGFGPAVQAPTTITLMEVLA